MLKNQVGGRDDHHPVVRVLALLAEQRIALTRQIHQFCFSNTSERYTRRIVKQLSSKGWISPQAVIGKSGKATRAYELTQKGFEEFCSMTGFGTNNVPRRAHSRDHDMTLTDIRIRFSHCSRVQIYLTENLLQMKVFEGICPELSTLRSGFHDAAVQLSTSGKKSWMAVEFERSDKTLDRNIERFQRWYQSEELKGILLIADDDTFMNRLVQVDRKTYPNFQRKVLFCSLTDFLSESNIVSFQNSAGQKISLEFSQISNRQHPILDQELDLS